MGKAVTSMGLLFSSSSSLVSFPKPLKFPSSFNSISTLRPLSSFLSSKNGGKSKQSSKPSPPVSASILKSKSKSEAKAKAKELLGLIKRRTRSVKEFDAECLKRYGDEGSHVPVMLGEVLDVFSSSFLLHSFVDCTLGAAGHSSAIVQAHPELQQYIGLDVDPKAHEKAQARMNDLVLGDCPHWPANLKVHFVIRNFKEIKQVIAELDKKLSVSGVNGILLDLGMSSMQVDDPERGFSMLNNGPLDMRMDPKATLRAEDILNTWPADEVGRILRDYGEESNWYYLQGKIIKARLAGGLHSTGELVDLIHGTTSGTRGGRQGWIKTSARVFQALRIAVNDELRTLEGSLCACFDCLASGGRLAVISFHSLEDRIVKQTFLKLISNGQAQEEGDEESGAELTYITAHSFEEEPWIKQIIAGSKGIILTKRPITASLEEEKINSRSRSAKLRVIEKI
ncbi:hypothetical protein Dimus_020853 [Dionaea muscipula]